MSLALGIALYFVIWWTILFAVLPFGVRTQAEDGSVVPGTPESAPVRPRLLRLFLVNSLVAAVIFGCVWATIVYRILPLESFPLLPQ